MPPKPKVMALLLCDTVSRDTASGKTTLVGVFDSVAAPAFPVVHGGFAIYFKVSDLNGEYLLSLQVVAPDLTTVLAEAKANKPMKVSDPLAILDIGISFLGVRFDAPGRYAVRLLYNGEQAELISFLVEKA